MTVSVLVLGVGIVLALVVLAAWPLRSKAEGFSAPVPSAMVIVEPRQHKHLAYVLENFDRRMPATWDLYIFHGIKNEQYARNAAHNITKRRKVHFVALGTDNLTVDEYNVLLKSPERFWSKIQAENILVFQTDAILCSGTNFSISNFDHLGYIGCAYDLKAGKGTHWKDNSYWGVGGLSFRKKSAALDCIANLPHTPEMPEDVFFSECVDAGYGVRPTDGNQLAEFCSQGGFYRKSFGAHRLDTMKKDDRPKFLQYCPEAAPLLN